MDYLHTYMSARARFYRHADECRASFFYFSPLNLIPKLVLGKLTFAACGQTYVITSPDGTARIMPTNPPAEYYADVLNALGGGFSSVSLIPEFSSVTLVPEWISRHLAKAYSCRVFHHENIMRSEMILTTPGKRFARYRNYAHALSRQTNIEEFDKSKVADYLALNADWYKRSQATKFRTYDKLSIDWMLENWALIKKLAPDCVLVGIRNTNTNKLIAFCAGCEVSAAQWTYYTCRYDKESELPGSLYYGYAHLATRFKQPLENNGTADSKEIKQHKARYNPTMLTAFEVSRK